MELPEGRIVVFVFVAFLALLSYFGFDLKQILQERVSELFPPLILEKPQQQPDLGQVYSDSASSPDSPTVFPHLDQLLERRKGPHPIETISMSSYRN
jgi:hypothetical protein